MDQELKEYRLLLLHTSQKLQESYDKLVITLSGGSLGLSLVFLRDVIKENAIIHSSFLMVSWILLILSLTSILLSVLFGISAYEKAVRQVDNETIYTEECGGIFSKLTRIFHNLGAVFLIFGVVFLMLFAFINMEGKNAEGQNTTQTTAETPSK